VAWNKLNIIGFAGDSKLRDIRGRSSLQVGTARDERLRKNRLI